MGTRATDAKKDLKWTYIHRWSVLRDFLKNRIGSHDLAEDALQETWFRLARLDPKAEPIRDPQAYILRVAGNVAIDMIRKESRHGAVCVSDDAVLSAIADTSPSPEHYVIDRDQLRQLALALSELPKAARTALLLQRCDGLTHRDISAKLGVSESMVAKYLAQALRHCRDHFRRIG
ncbi:MAG: RNA polymerase sigma factor [Parvibaculaceae bacterium]|nr:RNA polymerase sigma factor [Parvibaculaceae bacterium]